MKQSIIDKLSAPIQKDMLRVEGIMKKLEMNFAEGYMDEVAEAICRIRPQTQTKVRPIDLKEAWEFSNRAIRVATDLARIKLAEKIKAEYLSRATADETKLKGWSNKAALYFIYGMDYERPITEKLDKAVEAEVYDEIKKHLGFE
jgi:hypothetical protein